MTELEKMKQGLPFNASDEEVRRKIVEVKDLLWEYNNLRPSLSEEGNALLKRIIGKTGEDFFFIQPFYCDYGENIEVGEHFFANHNLIVLDGARVKIGDNAFIGPNVSIYTACHPLDAARRNTHLEWGRPVTIGNNVWIGGSATICPGVTIGDNVVIGAGSVVVKDIPSNVVAVGNPARIVKDLPKE